MSQVVIASYTVQSVFKVPKGVDIEKLMKENRAYVKWDTLNLCLEGDIEDDKNWIEIEASVPASEFDFKRPDDVVVDDKPNWLCDPDEDEDCESCEDCGKIVKEGDYMIDESKEALLLCSSCYNEEN